MSREEGLLARQLSSSFRPSVRMYQFGSQWTNFPEIWYYENM